ncbi:MAG: hypothetical protein HXX09_17095, partial [Bacteroidetes bacterium]|nr:hypothetical protein [Bacteroidota bacterium]
TGGSGSPNIFKIDLIGNTILGSFPIITGSGYDGLEYCSATNKLYFASSNSPIKEVNQAGSGLGSAIGTSVPTYGSFCIDPNGNFAYYLQGTTVEKVNLANGATTTFLSGISAQPYCDLEFGPSSSGTGMSLYVGGDNIIYEIIDVAAPIANIASLPNITDACSVTPTAPTANDNFAGTITGTTTTTFPITTEGTTIITWTYNDGNGHISTQTQTVIIDDVTPPQILSGTTSFVIPSGGNTSGWSPWTYTFADPVPAGQYVTGIDLTFTGVDQGWGGTGANAEMYVSGTHIGYGTLSHTSQTFTINYTGAIPAYVYGGNNDLQMFFVGYSGWVGYWQGGTMTIHYGLPVITGECSASILTPPTVIDNCAGIVSGTTTDSISFSTQGTHIVNWTFDDGNGNTSTDVQLIVIDDITSPVADISTLPTVTGQCSATAVTPTATDNCIGSITATTTDPLTYTNPGTYTINWTYDDGNGNTTLQIQTVSVADTILPTITAPADLIVCYGTGINLGTPTTADNCSIVNVTNDAPAVFPIGNTSVIWTVTDVTGNDTTAIQTVTVNPLIDLSTTLIGVTISANENGATYQWIDCNNSNLPIAGQTNQS